MTLFSDFPPMNGPGHSFIAARVVAVFGVPIETLLEKQLFEKAPGGRSWKREFWSLLRLLRFNSFSFPTLSLFGGRTLARTGVAFLTNPN